jgi:chromosomal replication initiator protein
VKSEDGKANQEEVRWLPVSQTLTEGNRCAAGINFFSRNGFIIGQENALLEPVLQQIIDNAVPAANLPVLFYGTGGGIAGLGRTHLLRGLKALSGREGLYLTAADFARKFRNAIATRSNAAFRRQCLTAPLLLIDDLENIAGNEAVQTELRFVLDDRNQRGAITVFAAAAHPAAVYPVQEYRQDFVQRLVQGTAVPLFLPGLAVRKYFVQAAAEHFQVHHPLPLLRKKQTDKKLSALAGERTLPLPQLYAEVAEMYINGIPDETETTAKESERKKIIVTTASALTLNEICKRTAKHYGCRLSDLRGTSRKKTLAAARSVAVFLARNLLQCPFSEIADYFSKRDASTIRHLAASVQSRCVSDAALRSDLAQLGLR